MAQTATARHPSTTRVPAFEAEGNLFALVPKSALGKDHLDIVVVGAKPGSAALIAELTSYSAGSLAVAPKVRIAGSFDVNLIIQTHPDQDHSAALGALLSRLRRALLRAAEIATDDLVHRALERPSDMGAVIDLLRSTLPMLSAEQELDPSLGEQVSALAVEDELMHRAGGLRDAKWVAEYLGINPKSVTAKARRNELLALTKGDRNFYPAFQFQNGQVMPGLRDLLQALPLTNGWSRLSFLVSPDPALDDRTPVEAFSTERETVLALAAGADTQGAA